MGMASFFHSLNVRAPLSRADIETLLRRHCRVRAYPSRIGIRRRGSENSRLSLDNRTVVEIARADEGARLTFETGFSDYENGLRYLFEIAAMLMTQGTVELLLPVGEALPLSVNDFEAFRTALKRSHAEKYRWFVNRYGEGQGRPCLPNRFFRSRRR